MDKQTTPSVLAPADPIGQEIYLQTPSMVWRGKEGRLVSWDRGTQDTNKHSMAVVEVYDVDMGWSVPAPSCRLQLPARCVYLKETRKYLGQAELEAVSSILEQQLASGAAQPQGQDQAKEQESTLVPVQDATTTDDESIVTKAVSAVPQVEEPEAKTPTVLPPPPPKRGRRGGSGSSAPAAA